MHYSENDSSSTKPIMVIVSDGGPDHRVTFGSVTFGSVQVAMLTLFMSLDLDMLVCMRTCPYQSRRNVAERVLNSALQNVSLARTAMPHRYEKLVKNKNTLRDLRQAVVDTPDLGDASMSAPMITIGEIFQRMEIKGNALKSGIPATKLQMKEQFELILDIEPSLSQENLTKKKMEKATLLRGFRKAHCHESAYMFQVKESTCSYCSKHPVRMEMELFSQLSFMPLPLLDEHYKAFTDVYGNPLSDKDLPSRVAIPNEEQITADRQRKLLLVAGKVRATISCDECQKQRCIYSQSVLTAGQHNLIADLKDSRLYSCGGLFPNSSQFENAIVVRQALVCNSPTENQYYSATLVNFPPVCYHCGLGEESLVENDYIQELRQCYATVLPICFICLDDGKKPLTKKPNNLAKRRKLS